MKALIELAPIGEGHSVNKNGSTIFGVDGQHLSKNDDVVTEHTKSRVSPNQAN